MSGQVRIAGMLAGTRVNGPGERTVLWLQGCTLACPGCINPHTHPKEGGHARDIGELAAELASMTPSGAYTISGGEPFQQAGGLLELCRALTAAGATSIVVFTGQTEEELHAQRFWFAAGAPSFWEAFTGGAPLVDALITGRYDRTRPFNRDYRSSENQRVVLTSRRHTMDEFSGPLGYETHIEDGVAVTTGFPTVRAT